MIVGIRPSARLTFTPLISTSDAGRSWSDGLVTAGACGAARCPGRGCCRPGPGAGRRRDGTEVLSSAGGLSNWRAVDRARALWLPRAPGQSCGLGSLTAVGYLAGQALVGGSCAVPGLSRSSANRPGLGALSAPPFPARLSLVGSRCWLWGRRRVATLSWRSSQRQPRPTSSPPGLAPVAGGPPRRLLRSPDEQVASFGPADGSGLFVLMKAPSGDRRLFVAEGSGAAWRELPSPPPGTATVAFGAGSSCMRHGRHGHQAHRLVPGPAGQPVGREPGHQVPSSTGPRREHRGSTVTPRRPRLGGNKPSVRCEEARGGLSPPRRRTLPTGGAGARSSPRQLSGVPPLRAHSGGPRPPCPPTGAEAGP